MIDIGNLRSTFSGKYGSTARVFRAPGRVNLIGEHTDYNSGFVLPCAIDRATYVAASRRNDRKIMVASMTFDQEYELDLDDLRMQPEPVWARYLQGVCAILERQGLRLSGADLLIDSDVPVGAGLSSSAALEIAAAFALASLSGQVIDPMELARIGQAAEHEFVGVRCGIMDQFSSVFGKAGDALFLDCRSMEWSSIPVSGGRLVICNTKTKHALADGEYNKRRAECEAAAEFLGYGSLRDVAFDEFASKAATMPENLKKRARHVITENARVVNAVDALRRGDLAAFGDLINRSHESLSGDFEVSTAELDLMVNLARRNKAVLGARMTGGGFGGCTVNLLAPGHKGDFLEMVSNAYFRETGIVPDIYECKTGDGVSEILTS